MKVAGYVPRMDLNVLRRNITHFSTVAEFHFHIK